jgi:predicted phosphodiesterase
MAFQIVSDLHLESPKAYDVFEIVPKALYLALLGDIGNIVPHKEEVLAFLTTQLKQFQVVLFVPGNHEAYGSTWAATYEVMRSFEKSVQSDDSLGEFILLDRGTFRVPGEKVIVLGCSLFSSVPQKDEMAVSFGVNDFFQIHDWGVAAHNEAHRKDLAWLNDQVRSLQDSDFQILIFTHWSPTTDARSSDPKHGNSAIKSGFSTDLSNELCFLNQNVRMWAFGHTHYNCDFVVERKEANTGPIRLVANQRGYYFAQADGFDVGKIASASVV